MATTISRDEATDALATEPAMRTLLRILRARYGAGWRNLTVDHIRDELDAAGITGQQVGCVVTAATRRGWIADSGRTVPSRAAGARGRRVVQWQLVGWRMPEVTG